MNSILQKSFAENPTTIIPNLGSFVKMGKTLMFNEFLKYDDGKLVTIAAEVKGISDDEARTFIAKWVAEANEEFAKGKQINIIGVGVLEKKEGKILFTQKAEAEVKQETKKDEPLVDATNSVVPTEKIENKETEKVEKVAEKKEEGKADPKSVLSAGLSAADAIAKIKKFKDKKELIAFTRGENRKTVVESLNKRLGKLNKKELLNPIPENEKIKEDKKEVKEVVPIDSKVVEKPIEVVEKVVEKNDEKPFDDVKKVIEKTIPTEVTKKIEKEEKKDKVVVPPIVMSENKEEQKTKEEPKIEKKKEATSEVVAAIAHSVSQTQKENKKRKRGWILWLALLFIFVGVGIFGYIKKDMVMSWFEKEHIPKELASNEEEEDQTKDSHEEQADVTDDNANDLSQEEKDIAAVTEEEDTTEDTAATEEQIAEDPVEEVEATEVAEVKSSSTGNYHLVAGSFSSEDNANNKVLYLKDNGYSGARVLGQYNGLFTVVAASFDSKSEAKETLAIFKEQGNKGFVKKL